MPVLLESTFALYTVFKLKIKLVYTWSDHPVIYLRQLVHNLDCLIHIL